MSLVERAAYGKADPRDVRLRSNSRVRIGISDKNITFWRLKGWDHLYATLDTLPFTQYKNNQNAGSFLKEIEVLLLLLLKMKCR